MIAPLNFEEGAIVKAKATSLSHAKPTENQTKEGSALPTDVTVIPYDVCTEGPLTYFRYYLEDADEFAHRSEQSPRSLQQKLVRTGLIGAGVLAALASGIAAMDALTKEQPNPNPNQPVTPPKTTPTPENQELSSTKATPQPSTPETIDLSPSSPLQFSLTPSTSIDQLRQPTAQLKQSPNSPPVLPALSTAQLEATQAAFSLPAPQLSTAPAIAALAPETQPQLTLAQNRQPSSPEAETTNSILNATSSDLVQPEISSPMNLASGAIVNNISPPESFITPLSATDAMNAIAAQPLASNSLDAGQSSVPNAAQPSSTTIASNFPMPTVQMATNADNGNAELALKPNLPTTTAPGDRWLEAVPSQPLAPIVSTAKPSTSTVAQPSVELPEQVSPGVRNLLQPNSQASGIQVAVMPLTQQESQEVAMRDRLGQFKVLRLNQPEYQQEWRTSNGDADSPAPTFGFVDYPRQVIAVIQTPTSTSTNIVPQPETTSSVTASAEEPAIAQE